MARILVADDDGGIRALLRDLFEGEGYDVIEAANGAEVLALFAAGSPPELALMDVRMPEGSGAGAIARIREARPATKVLVLTGAKAEEDLVESLRRGAV